MSTPEFEGLVAKACGLHESNTDVLNEAALDHRVAMVENLFDRVVLEKLRMRVNPQGSNPLCMLECYDRALVIFSTMGRYVIGVSQPGSLEYDDEHCQTPGEDCLTSFGPFAGEFLQKAVLQLWAGMRLKASDPFKANDSFN